MKTYSEVSVLCKELRQRHKEKDFMGTLLFNKMTTTIRHMQNLGILEEPEGRFLLMDLGYNQDRAEVILGGMPDTED